ELYYRIATRCEVAFVPEALVRYRVHGSNMHNNIAAMEYDVRIGFEKAFAGRSADVQAIRSEAIASFHTMLAGSYFHQANYGKFLSHAIASAWNKPSNIGNFFVRKTKFPKQ
ncbi:MAG: hypothetical protein ABL959_21910, partial [Pyrinomonadaceae bacterium]